MRVNQSLVRQRLSALVSSQHVEVTKLANVLLLLSLLLLQPASSLPPVWPKRCKSLRLRHASVITNYTCRPAVKTRRRVVKKRAQMTRLDF